MLTAPGVFLPPRVTRRLSLHALDQGYARTSAFFPGWPPSFEWSLHLPGFLVLYSAPARDQSLTLSRQTGLAYTPPTPNALAFTEFLRPFFVSISVNTTFIGRGGSLRSSCLGPPQFERKPHLTSGLPTHEVQQSINAAFYWNQNLGFSTSTTLLAASPKATHLPRVRTIKTPLLLLNSVAHFVLSLHGVYFPPCSY